MTFELLCLLLLIILFAFVWHAIVIVEKMVQINHVIINVITKKVGITDEEIHEAIKKDIAK